MQSAAWVESLLYAQYPDANCWTVEPTFEPPSPSDEIASCYLRMRRPGPFPIKRHPQLVDPMTRLAADPLDLLLHALGNLPPEHRATIALSLSPMRDRYRQSATVAMLALAGREIARAERLTDAFTCLALAPKWLAPVASLLGYLVRSGIPVQPQASGKPLSPEPSSTHERESDLQACLAKVRRHLFAAQVRVEVRGPRGAAELRDLLRLLTAAFAQFDLPGLNGLLPHRSRSTCILSTEEIATLWHLPTPVANAAHLSAAVCSPLPPPAILPDITPDSVILGETTYRREHRPIAISLADRRRHLYIVGKTGVGKTTLLEHLLLADIRAGRGVGLIDPHGDLATSILTRIPAARTNDVVIVDPADTLYAVSFNPLDCPRDRAALAADAVLSTFLKLFATGEFASWGPRLEDILRNALLALAEAGGATLLDVLRMLEDDDGFRSRLLRRVRDPLVSHWWREEFPKLKSNRREDPFASVTNKLRQLLTMPAIRDMLAQTRGKLDLRRAMDEGKIVLCNLSKGRLGERTSNFLGALLVARFQLDAMGRAEIPEHRRRDFFLYVDEFQNFATSNFSEILSEARKYRLSLTLANQFLGQMPSVLQSAILGNVATILSMQVGAEDATVLAEQLGEHLTPSDLVMLPRHHGVVRMEIHGSVAAPFAMRTAPPDAASRDRKRAELVLRHSRMRYGSPRRDVERAIARKM